MAIALSGGYTEKSALVSVVGQRQPPASGASPGAADDPAPITKTVSAKEIAGSERLATPADQARAYAAEPDFDAGLVRESFAHIAASPGPAMEYFYSHLFVRHPEMRSMFPESMRLHRERFFATLERIVWSIDNSDQLTAFLGQLGRDHRKYGVKDRHYEHVLSGLIDTVAHFCGHYWTQATAGAWEAALGQASSIMMAAARRDGALQPPWWIGEIVQHELRRPDLAVLTIRPDQPLRYSPGQYLTVQVPRWPRLWRNFSIANAPRENGLIDLHVRAVPGGMVSRSLVHHCAPGDTVLLGPARGEMTMPARSGRDVLCIAGGTGLAPIKAIIEGMAAAAPGGDGAAAAEARRIGLLFGARTEQDLYDLAALRELESACPALTVTPVVSDQPQFAGIRGTLPEAVARYASCQDKDIFVSGPAAMIRATVSALASRATANQIHCDPVETPLAGRPDDRMTGADTRPGNSRSAIAFHAMPSAAGVSRCVPKNA
jgi:NAD(P)H-flavin reductase/hemoglobin-like flavoprotein